MKVLFQVLAMRFYFSLFYILSSFSLFSQNNQQYEYLLNSNTVNPDIISGERINCPIQLIGYVDTYQDGTISSYYQIIDSIGYAIDYNLMFIAKSYDNGQTWDIINENCQMPFNLKVITKEIVIVYSLCTDENTKGYTSLSILLTINGGLSWYELFPPNGFTFP